MIYINLNSDYNVLLGRMLVLMQELSFAKENERILTIERIVIYDFFLRYPLLLVRATKVMNKKINLDIKDSEVNTVQTFYPTYSDLYKLKNAKVLLQILYSKGFVEIENSEDGEMFVSITQAGIENAMKLESAYFARLREISKAVSLLHSISFSVLRNSVNSLLYE
jgi:hypothetical protein